MQNNFYNYADLTFGVFFREGVLDFLRKGLSAKFGRPLRNFMNTVLRHHFGGK